MNTGISAVIITRNEAHNIARCIDALSLVSDDIVVVDAFSKDATPDICRRLGVRFYSKEWEGFSAQKNYANGLAQNDYILSIDADEVVGQELRNSILQAVQNGLNGTYSFNRLTNYCGHWIRHSGWYPDIKVRLFPKKHTRWEGAFVHESLVFEPPLANTHLKGDLLHYSYSTSKEHRMRADKYSELTAKKMHIQNKRAGILKPWLSGFVRFMDMYFLKAGFLDGWAGFQIAWISAASNVFKYQKLRELQSKNRHE